MLILVFDVSSASDFPFFLSWSLCNALFVNLVHKFSLTSLLMRTPTSVFVFNMVTVRIMIIWWKVSIMQFIERLDVGYLKRISYWLFIPFPSTVHLKNAITSNTMGRVYKTIFSTWGMYYKNAYLQWMFESM